MTEDSEKVIGSLIADFSSLPAGGDIEPLRSRFLAFAASEYGSFYILSQADKLLARSDQKSFASEIIAKASANDAINTIWGHQTNKLKSGPGKD